MKYLLSIICAVSFVYSSAVSGEVTKEEAQSLFEKLIAYHNPLSEIERKNLCKAIGDEATPTDLKVYALGLLLIEAHSVVEDNRGHPVVHDLIETSARRVSNCNQNTSFRIIDFVSLFYAVLPKPQKIKVWENIRSEKPDLQRIVFIAVGCFPSTDETVDIPIVSSLFIPISKEINNGSENQAVLQSELPSICLEAIFGAYQTGNCTFDFLHELVEAISAKCDADIHEKLFREYRKAVELYKLGLP